MGAFEIGQLLTDHERGRPGSGRRREMPIVLDVREITLGGFGEARGAGHDKIRRPDHLPLNGPCDVAERVRPSVLAGRHSGYPFFFGFDRGDGGFAATRRAGATFPSMYAVTLPTVISLAKS